MPRLNGLMCLMAMGFPYFQKIRVKARAVTAARELRVFSEAIQQYTLMNGRWPGSGTPGRLPVDLDGFIVKSKWEHRTPVGGQYNWISLSFGAQFTYAFIHLPGVDKDHPQVLELDKIIDDGNISTGTLRTFSGTQMIYCLECPPGF